MESLLLSDQRRFFALGSLFQPLDFRRSFSAEASRPLAPLVVPSHNDGFVAAVELCKKHHSPVPIPPNDSVSSNVRGHLLNCCSPDVDDSAAPRGSVWLTQPCWYKKIHDKLVSIKIKLTEILILEKRKIKKNTKSLIFLYIYKY